MECKYYVENEFNAALKKYNDSKFSIFHTNIRSLNKHHKELVTYLSLLNMKFDCICLSEVWNYNLEFYRNILQNYVSYFEPPKGTNIGGIAIFINCDLKVNNKTRDYLIESSETVKVENLWYEITKDKQKYLVGMIYRHPKGNLTEFNEKLDNTLSKITSDRNINDCIITANLNIDLIQFNTDTQSENYLNTMLRNAFMPTIILPTRIEKKACTLLDHIFYYSNTFRSNLFSGNMFVDINDHLANFLILGPKQTRKDRKNVRIFSDANKSKFKENLSNIDWTNELKCKTVNEAMFFFYQTITKAYNKSFPIVKLSRKRAKDRPWITSGLKSSIKKKHILYRRFLLDKSDKSHMEYKTYNNKLRTIIREAEISYYKKLFNEKESGIKQMWKTLSPILNKKKNKPNQKSINKLIIDGKAVYNDKQIADALNEYFSSVGNTLSKQISNKNRSYKDYLKNPLPRSIYLTPTDEKEICTEIDKLKPKKSTLDIFNINMLKYVKDEMIPGLVIIFNKSISEGIFPELLKTAKVIPIYKKDDTNFTKNY